MSVKAAVVAVGTSATLLNTFGDSDGVFGNSVAVYNSGAAAVYVGGSDVTSATGFALPAGTSMGCDLKPNDALYAVAASGTVTVNVLATGV